MKGGPEKRFTEAPSGDIWALIHTGAKNARFLHSHDFGVQWYNSASTSDLTLAQFNTILAFHIDAQGYAHVVWTAWDVSPQTLRYSRGVPYGGHHDRSSWRWTHHTISPAAGRLSAAVDVVAIRQGTGWKVWLYWGLVSGGHRLTRLGVSAKGVISTEATIVDPGNSAGNWPIGGLEFGHVGDGFTASPSPHLFLTTASQRTAQDIRLHRAAYSSGTWAFGNTVLLETGSVGKSTIRSLWDGALLCTAWIRDADTAIRFATWDGVATAATRVDPPALPAGLGAINGLALSHDPDTDDIFLIIHDATDGDIRWTRFRRSNSTWDAWLNGPARTASADSQVQALPHPRFGNVDIVYSTDGRLFHHRLVALSRKPGAPSLLSPPNGRALDLNTNGASFDWRYNRASKGDSQQAYAFRRTIGTTTEWWNASSRAWQATEVMNASSRSSASFPAGLWLAGTYSWSIKTRSATGVDSDYSAARSVVSAVAPEIEVTSPFGLVYAESTPTVTWEYTGTEAQRDYEIRIVEAAGVIDENNPGPSVWTSGLVQSSIARAHTIGESLTGDRAYRAYVRVSSLSGLTSVWEHSDFSITILPPTGPSVGVVDELAYPTNIPRAQLNIKGRSNYMLPEWTYGQAGWEALSNATIAAEPADLATLIEESLRITTAAAGAASARTILGDPPAAPADEPAPTGPLAFPVLPGATYTAMAHLRAGVAARAGRVSIEWWTDDDGTGTLISTVDGNQVNLTDSSYTKALVSASAPGNAALARVVVTGLGAAAGGEVFYATRMSIHPGRSVDWQPGGYSNQQTVKVERSVDDGATWVLVLDRIKTDYWQNAVTFDRSIPFGRRVRYRAFTNVDLGSGSILTSAVSEESMVIFDTPAWIIRDPDDENGEIFALVQDLKRKDSEAITVHRTVGRSYPVLDSEGFQSGEGTMQVYLPASQIATARDLLSRPKTMLVQSPIGEVLYLRLHDRDYSVEALRNRIVDIDFIEMDSLTTSPVQSG